jgi:hypothetical protein
MRSIFSSRTGAPLDLRGLDKRVEAGARAGNEPHEESKKPKGTEQTRNPIQMRSPKQSQRRTKSPEKTQSPNDEQSRNESGSSAKKEREKQYLSNLSVWHVLGIPDPFAHGLRPDFPFSEGIEQEGGNVAREIRTSVTPAQKRFLREVQKAQVEKAEKAQMEKSQMEKSQKSGSTTGLTQNQAEKAREEDRSDVLLSRDPRYNSNHLGSVAGKDPTDTLVTLETTVF